MFPCLGGSETYLERCLGPCCKTACLCLCMTDEYPVPPEPRRDDEHNDVSASVSLFIFLDVITAARMERGLMNGITMGSNYVPRILQFYLNLLYALRHWIQLRLVGVGSVGKAAGISP